MTLNGTLQWLCDVVVGARYPEGDEDACRNLATQWAVLKDQLKNVKPVIEQARNKSIQGFPSGEFHDSLLEYIDKLPEDIDHLIANMESMENGLKGVAEDIEEAKRAFYIALAALAASIVVSWIPFVNAAAVGIARAAIFIAVRTVIGKILARAAAVVAVKLATRPALKAAVTVVTRGALLAGEGALVGATSMAAYEFTRQGLSIAVGDQEGGLDWGAIRASAKSGAWMGGVGAPLSKVPIFKTNSAVVNAAQRFGVRTMANTTGIIASQQFVEGHIDLRHALSAGAAFALVDPVMNAPAERVAQHAGDALGIRSNTEAMQPDRASFRESVSDNVRDIVRENIASRTETPVAAMQHSNAGLDHSPPVTHEVGPRIDGGPQQGVHPGVDPRSAPAAFTHGGSEAGVPRHVAPEVRSGESAAPAPRPEQPNAVRGAAPSSTPSVGAHNGAPVAQHVAEARAAAPATDAAATRPAGEAGVTRATDLGGTRGEGPAPNQPVEAGAPNRPGDAPTARGPENLVRPASAEGTSTVEPRGSQQLTRDALGGQQAQSGATEPRIGRGPDQPVAGTGGADRSGPGPDRPGPGPDRSGPDRQGGIEPDRPVPAEVSTWEPSNPRDVARAVDYVKGDNTALESLDKNSRAYTRAVHELTEQRAQRWHDLDPAMREAIVNHEIRDGHFSELAGLKENLPLDVHSKFVDHNLVERFIREHPECPPEVIRRWTQEMDAHLRDPEHHERPNPQSDEFKRLPDTHRRGLLGEGLRALRVDAEVRSVDRIFHERFHPPEGSKPLHMLRFDPHEFGRDGEVIMGIGELHAKEVTVYTPGIRSTALTFDGIVRDAQNLHIRVDAKGGDVPRLTVAYLGYDAPSGLRILGQTITPAFAEAGGHRLAHDVAALHGSLEGNPVVRLIGHSYGSTTTAYAGAGGRVAEYVHSITLAGSPGAGPVTHASEFSHGPHQVDVYVASSSGDIVTKFGSSKDFGYPVYGRIADLPISGRILDRFARLPVVGGAFERAGAMFDRAGHYLDRFADPGAGKILGRFGLGIDPADPRWGGTRVGAEYAAPELKGAIGSHTNMFSSETIADGKPVPLTENPHVRASESLENISNIIAGHTDRLTFDAPHDPQHRFFGDPARARDAEPASGYPGPNECVRQGIEWFNERHPDASIEQVADHHGQGVRSTDLERALGSRLRDATPEDITRALEEGKSVWVVDSYDPAALPPGHPGAHLTIVEPHPNGMRVFDSGAETIASRLPTDSRVIGTKIVTFHPDGTPTHPLGDVTARSGHPEEAPGLVDSGGQTRPGPRDAADAYDPAIGRKLERGEGHPLRIKDDDKPPLVDRPELGVNERGETVTERRYQWTDHLAAEGAHPARDVARQHIETDFPVGTHPEFPTAHVREVDVVVGENSARFTVVDGVAVRAKVIITEAFHSVGRPSSELTAQSMLSSAAYDAGHLLGFRFGLDEGLVNLFEQAKNFNRSAYLTMENEWAAWAEHGGRVEATIRLQDADGAVPTTTRPGTVKVDYRVFEHGTTDGAVYKNERDFANNDGQTFERLSVEEIKQKLGVDQPIDPATPIVDGAPPGSATLQDAAGYHNLHSTEPAGPGWVRDADQHQSGTGMTPHGEPLPVHDPDVAPLDPARTDPGVTALVADPDAPYGRDASGNTYSHHEYLERFRMPGPNPGEHYVAFPDNGGAVDGTKLRYHDPHRYVEDFGNQMDRIGSRDGSYLGLVVNDSPATFETRAIDYEARYQPYEGYTFNPDAMVRHGCAIQISEIKPALGRPGGAGQMLVFDDRGRVLTVRDLIRMGVLVPR